MSSRLMSLLQNDRNTEEGRACLDEGRAAGGGTFPICWVFRLSAVSPHLSSRRLLHTSSTRAHMPSVGKANTCTPCDTHCCIPCHHRVAFITSDSVAKTPLGRQLDCSTTW